MNYVQSSLESTHHLMEWISRSEEMINTMPGCFFWKAPDLTYIGMSQALVKFAKIRSSKAVLCHTDYDLPWEKYAEDYRTGDYEVLLGKTLTFLEPIQTNDGNAHTILTIKKPVKNKEGKILAVAGQLYPITNKNSPYKIPSTLNTLSSREKECLFYLVRGKTAKSIGKLLGLSPRTVESYVHNIKCKWGVLTKSELIDKALEKGFGQILPGFSFSSLELEES